MITRTRQSANVIDVSKTLFSWLARHLELTAQSWLEESVQLLSTAPTERTLFTRFSITSRKVGKADLELTDADLMQAETLRPGWQPHNWSVDQVARTLLLLTFPAHEADRYVAAVEKLLSAADMAEQVAVYQTLPLLPHPARFVAHAIEGLRTNMRAVFDAIALRNPYPAEYFDEAAWNQMVLKALFVDSHLSQIQGIDDRANAELARMLSDYAHERWAAGRSVNPQLWRSLGPFAEGKLVDDLERLFQSPDITEREAAALACAVAPDPKAKALLASAPELAHRIAQNQLTWKSLALTHP